MRGNYTNDVSRYVKALNTIRQNDVHFLRKFCQSASFSTASACLLACLPERQFCQSASLPVLPERQFARVPVSPVLPERQFARVLHGLITTISRHHNPRKS